MNDELTITENLAVHNNKNTETLSHLASISKINQQTRMFRNKKTIN